MYFLIAEGPELLGETRALHLYALVVTTCNATYIFTRAPKKTANKS